MLRRRLSTQSKKQKVRSRQSLSGRGHRPLPQERPRQRSVSFAGLLSPGQYPARRGRTPRRPDLRAQEGGPARGPGRAAPLHRPGLVRQASDGLHARHRAGQLGGFRVVPGRHRPRLAGLPRPGTGHYGESLAQGEEHMAKLAVNALIAVWAPVQARLLQHARDGRGCQYQQVFFDDQGQCHSDHVYATELFSNRSMRPAHDFVMASEYVELRGSTGPCERCRRAAAVRGGAEDRLPGLSGPSAKVRAHRGVEALTRRAPPGRHPEVSLR